MVLIELLYYAISRLICDIIPSIFWQYYETKPANTARMVKCCYISSKIVFFLQISHSIKYLYLKQRLYIGIEYNCYKFNISCQFFASYLKLLIMKLNVKFQYYHPWENEIFWWKLNPFLKSSTLPLIVFISPGLSLSSFLLPLGGKTLMF